MQIQRLWPRCCPSLVAIVTSRGVASCLCRHRRHCAMRAPPLRHPSKSLFHVDHSTNSIVAEERNLVCSSDRSSQGLRLQTQPLSNQDWSSHHIRGGSTEEASSKKLPDSTLTSCPRHRPVETEAPSIKLGEPPHPIFRKSTRSYEVCRRNSAGNDVDTHSSVTISTSSTS